MNNYHHLLLLLMVFSACTHYTDTKKESSPKFQQYYIEGERLYLQHCSNCHQKNGKGLGLVYPPLDSSDYMTMHFDEVICLIKNGRSGELIVNGKSYNQKMNGFPTMSDLEIAEISTYIYNTWTHEKGLIDVKEVSTVLNQCNEL